MKKPVKNSPAKRSLVIKSPAKNSPSKSKDKKVQASPENRKQKDNKAKSKEQKIVYTSSLEFPRGAKLGWNFFLRARPETHPELNEWLSSTWGSSHPTTRRGFHISGLKKDSQDKFYKLYKKVYQTDTIINNEVGTVFARAFASSHQGGIEVDWDDFAQHRYAFQRGGSSSVKLEDLDPLKIAHTPCKTESHSCEGLQRDGLQKYEMTESQLHAMLTCKSRVEVRNHSLEEVLEAACRSEMEAAKKCSSITSTSDWILSTIQNSQSEVFKTELQKEIEKIQRDLNAAKNELQSAKRDRNRIEEQMRGSNEFMQNTMCLADTLYVQGLRAIYPAPVPHPVAPASLLVSIEW